MRVSDHRQIVCPHELACEVRFTESSGKGIAVTIDGIDCAACSEKINRADTSAAEWRSLLVRGYITPALGTS